MEEIIWKDYKINKKIIGKGSFSKVYKAFHIKEQKFYALKKIPFFEFSSNLKKRIHNELFILQNVDHPNVVKFIDFEYEHNFLFIIFEYCEDNIASLFNKNMYEDDLKKIFYEIVSGLDYLHSKNILHRDIKPENILLKDNKPKICDFGFSTMIKDEYSLKMTICGTPIYMSPETLFFKPYSKKSDIWSLGILFYMIAYKNHPFNDINSIDDYKSRIKFNNMVFDDNKFSNIFNDLLKNMLKIKENDRYSISDVLNHPWFRSCNIVEDLLIFPVEDEIFSFSDYKSCLENNDVTNKSCLENNDVTNKSCLENNDVTNSHISFENNNIEQINKRDYVHKKIKKNQFNNYMQKIDNYYENYFSVNDTKNNSNEREVSNPISINNKYSESYNQKNYSSPIKNILYSSYDFLIKGFSKFSL